MGTPKTLEFVTGRLLWRTPSFGRTEHDHRPMGPARDTSPSAFPLNFPDLLNAMFNSRSHGLMHRVGIRSFYKVRLPSVTPQQAFQLFVVDARQKRWIVDFVSVQMKDRQ